MIKPVSAFAQGAAAPGVSASPPPPADPRIPIITDQEFEEAVPRLDEAPMESVEQWQKQQDVDEAQQRAAAGEQNAIPALQDGDVVDFRHNV